ncbi:MAG: hypothetical protein KGI33_05025 [Thaumarchaeota archaeon]|nr:hypothetical protein [Nitrososphaerota archaeon]
MIDGVILQYYCSECEGVLRETESEVSLSSITEPCPFCGSLLSESLQKRSLMPREEREVAFQQASRVPRLGIDIRKIESAIPFLSTGQKVALVGRHSQKILERLAVRAQMPARHGGLDSHVVLVDGGNISDPYLCIDFARQYGLDVNLVMSRIISSRAFTVHQLEYLVSHELSGVVKKYGARLVMLSDMLAMFPGASLDGAEAKWLLDSVSAALSRLKDCLVIMSISEPTVYDGMLLGSFDRVIRLSEMGGIVTVGLEGRDCAIKESDLEAVPRR